MRDRAIIKKKHERRCGRTGKYNVVKPYVIDCLIVLESELTDIQTRGSGSLREAKEFLNTLLAS